jgi:hypothetical protein
MVSVGIILKEMSYSHGNYPITDKVKERKVNERKQDYTKLYESIVEVSK